MSIREAARRVARDIRVLLDAGILDRTEDGRFIFAFDAVHVDFTLTAAA